jgi:hypothetical protein
MLENYGKSGALTLQRYLMSFILDFVGQPAILVNKQLTQGGWPCYPLFEMMIIFIQCLNSILKKAMLKVF